ncbi:Golgi-associated kinase 1B-like [Polyodon spathula]|uniref:Golgi-associated kinase 1B-like n=1 Tax=Polyodon spathula TaxID=7913 RepID=UPI001B7F3DAF|nr:Golgi-associated kinase 1B-like [Polyodon spathula]
MEKPLFLHCKIIDVLVLHPCVWILRIWNTRRLRSKRNLLIASACFIYAFFLVAQVGLGVPRDMVSERQKYKRSEEVHVSKLESPLDSTQSRAMRAGDTSPDIYFSLQPNVVYITLKSKRSKPANIRGTVRPKLRRKHSIKKAEVDQNGLQFLGGADHLNEDNRLVSNNNKGYGDEIARKTTQSDAQVNSDIKRAIPRQKMGMVGLESNIRIYSESAPPWLSKEDIEALRILADCNVTAIQDDPSKHRGLILFESAGDLSLRPLGESINGVEETSFCRGRCGLVKRPMDMSEVFAFHLDRILGLNRSFPAVCRRFTLFQDGHPCPVILWDSSLSPADNEAQSTVRLNWGSYQHSLKQKCWHRGIVPKAEWGCSNVHHFEWSKLALFDFMLQVYNRLDRNCCGFRPRKEDTCVERGLHLKCDDQDSVELVHIIQRKLDPRHLVFIDNRGYFDRGEDNLDFKLLKGIKELPESAVSVLKSQRLRERLLQSLFLDKVYWESQGGRQGIEKLIDVIERRAKILLTYINAHGIKVIPMNE